MLPAIGAAMMVADYLRKQKDAEQAKREKAAGILQSSAASLGAPTYNVEAGEAQHQYMHDAPNPMSTAMGIIGGTNQDTQGESPAQGVLDFMDRTKRKQTDYNPYGGGGSY